MGASHLLLDLNLHAFEQSVSDICENLLANPFIALQTSDIAFDGTLSDFGTWL
jgi:phosphoribosylformylglycinamidine (FGAM) synthase PurS component